MSTKRPAPKSSATGDEVKRVIRAFVKANGFYPRNRDGAI